ncbi:MAG: ArsR/SmtB family transcription factor [Spirochaetota bacterium]
MRNTACGSRYEATFSALGDETRLRLARVLVEAGLALCLPELVDIVRRAQYAVSRAMAQLVRACLVCEPRRGRLSFYRLTNDSLSRLVLEAVRAIPIDDSKWVRDRDRLRWRLDLRQNDTCVVTHKRVIRRKSTGPRRINWQPTGDRLDVMSAGIERKPIARIWARVRPTSVRKDRRETTVAKAQGSLPSASPARSTGTSGSTPSMRTSTAGASNEPSIAGGTCGRNSP